MSRCFAFLLLILMQCAFAQETRSYFQYSQEELRLLQNTPPSKLQITREDLKKWDVVSDKYLMENNIPSTDCLRYYAYLYTAQRDVSFLPPTRQQKLTGSLDPISIKIATLFFSNFPKPQNYQLDTYSAALAQIAFPKYRKRFEEEQANDVQYELPGGSQYWSGKEPYVGIETASWIPWYLKSVSDYRPAAPPPSGDKAWEKQMESVKKAQRELTEEQKQTVYVWAGMSKSRSGDWVKIANDYMFDNYVPVDKMIFVRSILLQTLYDATIACYDSKYHYGVKRPDMIDPRFKPLIPTPNHPSYPAGHSVGAAAAATIMTHFFPDMAVYWYQLSEETGSSRIWAGIHFPLDHEAGKKMGREIALEILNQLHQ